MTTGTKSFGSESDPYYWSKTWSGTDGKYAGSKLVWNPYQMTGRSSRQTPGTDPRYPNYYLGTMWGPSGVTWTSNDTLALLGKLSGRAKGHTFNMGVAIGTSHQTFALVQGTLSRCVKSVHALKRGRVDLALKALGASPRGYHGKIYRQGPDGRRLPPDVLELTTKDVSALWLEIQYGWKPLIHDVHESMVAFSKIANKPRKTLIRVSMVKPAPDLISQNYYAKWRIESSQSRMIIWEMTEFLSQPRELGLQDPASVAWELLPWSFVADWFIPISTYLDAYNVIPALQGRFLMTVVTRSKTVGVGRNIPYLGASSHQVTTDLTRTVEGQLLVPTPQFENVLTSMTAGRIKNSIALLHQAMK